MRKFPVVTGVFVAATLAVAACGGSSPAASTLPTIPAVPSLAIPSFAIPSLNLGSFAIPSIAFPSFNANADPTLAAKFPTQVGGQPVTGVQTVNFVAFFQALAGDDESSASQLQSFVQLLGTNGVDATQLSFGSATTTVDGESVQIQAFRTPGGDINKFIALWPQLTALDDSEKTPPTVGTSNVGGKTVTTLTDPEDDSVTYIYAQGDTAWSVDSNDPAEAAAVFTALQ